MPRATSNSVPDTTHKIHFKISVESGIELQKSLTMRGPALKGTNIMGLSENVFNLSWSIHLSGSNTSASSPHRTGLRCNRKGSTTTDVDGGMYMGASRGDEEKVGSDRGRTVG